MGSSLYTHFKVEGLDPPLMLQSSPHFSAYGLVHKLKQVLNILHTNVSLCTDVECVPTVHILLVSKTTGAHHPHPTQHHPSLANPPHHAVQSHHNDRVELPPALSVHSLTGSQSHLAPLSPRKPQQPPEAKAKGMWCILS